MAHIGVSAAARTCADLASVPHHPAGRRHGSGRRVMLGVQPAMPQEGRCSTDDLRFEFGAARPAVHPGRLARLAPLHTGKGPGHDSERHHADCTVRLGCASRRASSLRSMARSRSCSNSDAQPSILELRLEPCSLGFGRLALLRLGTGRRAGVGWRGSADGFAGAGASGTIRSVLYPDGQPASVNSVSPVALVHWYSGCPRRRAERPHQEPPLRRPPTRQSTLCGTASFRFDCPARKTFYRTVRDDAAGSGAVRCPPLC